MSKSFRKPESVSEIGGEPTFDPAVHLDLQKPRDVWTLEDFGYRAEAIERAPFPLAVTSPFRVLSDEGLAVLRESVNALLDTRRESDRMANYIRGTLYRSRFIRELCLSPDVNAFVAELAGAPVLPHPMSLYQGHINLKPDDEAKDVDKWHTDTVVLDYVLLLTDPKSFEGGYFEYIQAAKPTAIRALIRDEATPSIVKVEFPQAGYAVLQQGNMVVHRASAVTRGDERTTLVQSFVPDCPNFVDVSKLDDCKLVDPHDVLFSEWARYKAFLSQRRLHALIESLPFTEDKNRICMDLRAAIRDVEEAILEISDPSEGRLVHYGQDALTDPS